MTSIKRPSYFYDDYYFSTCLLITGAACAIGCDNVAAKAVSPAGGYINDYDVAVKAVSITRGYINDDDAASFNGNTISAKENLLHSF
jgi:hypothetical protein